MDASTENRIDKGNIRLGSLFDGIGAFPYAGRFFGIRPVWASEILPAAISVTKRHFPEMEHMGDITKLSGKTLPPVHILTFGSPCQGLSSGGLRRGLKDPRSALFMEAIRIIREMREATHGEYPVFALWENVPGAIRTNSGRDFKAVLEAFTESEVPFPPSGKWANAGMVRSGGVDLAWIIYNSQYFGVPQRRRRLFALMDFGGQRAGTVLFEPKSLRRYFAAGGTPEQGPAAYAARSPHSEDCGEVAEQRTAAFLGGASAMSRSIGYSETVSPTLKSGACGLLAPCLCAAPGQPALCEPEIARTLLARGDSSPCADRGQNVVAIADSARPAGNERNIAFSFDSDSSNSMKSPNPFSGCRVTETARTLDTSYPCPSKNQGGIAILRARQTARPDICGALCASGAGLSRPAGMGSETDLCVVTPRLEPIPIHDRATRYSGGGDSRNNDGSGNGLGIGKSGGPSPTITAGDRHIVAAVDCRNRHESGVSGTLQSKSTGGYSLHYQNPVRTGYTIRRLTPTECERLMGLEDGYTAYGHDGKPISDSKRYSLLGNSVVTTCAAYILMGIADALSVSKEGKYPCQS